MAELPGNSQKPLAFGTICPAAFLLSLIRKGVGVDAKHQLSFRCNEVVEVGSSFFFLFAFFSSSLPSFSPSTFFHSLFISFI